MDPVERASALVDERISGIRDQALIVAGALAEYAADPDTRTIETDDAEPLLRQLIAPTRLRARVYATDGKLMIDTRYLLARNLVTVSDLPPVDQGRRDRFFDNVWHGSRPPTTASWGSGRSPISIPISRPATTAASITRWWRR